MNQLVEQRGGAAMAHPGARKAAQVGQLMRTADMLLEPYEQAAQFQRAYPHWRNPVCDFRDMSSRDLAVDVLKADSRWGEESRRRARIALRELPPLEAMERIKATMVAFRMAEHDSAKTRLLIALLVDRYPNLKAHEPTTFVEGLIHQAERGGHAPAVVARACNTVMETSKFLPTPAEFHTALEDAAWIKISTVDIDRAIDLRTTLEAALTAAELEIPEPAPPVTAATRDGPPKPKGPARVSFV